MPPEPPTPETAIISSLVVSQPVSSTMTLRDSVDQALANYFGQLEGVDVKDVYTMVLSEVEAPLLEQTLKFCRNNQTRAAQPRPDQRLGQTGHQ